MKLTPKAWLVVLAVLGIGTVVLTRPADDERPAPQPTWWWLAEPASPDDEVLRLVVHEGACADIEADTLVRGDELRVLVEVRRGDDGCDHAEHELRLREPLGDKRVVAVGCPPSGAPAGTVEQGPGCTG